MADAFLAGVVTGVAVVSLVALCYAVGEYLGRVFSKW